MWPGQLRRRVIYVPRVWITHMNCRLLLIWVGGLSWILGLRITNFFSSSSWKHCVFQLLSEYPKEAPTKNTQKSGDHNALSTSINSFHLPLRYRLFSHTAIIPPPPIQISLWLMISSINTFLKFSFRFLYFRSRAWWEPHYWEANNCTITWAFYC